MKTSNSGQKYNCNCSYGCPALLFLASWENIIKLEYHHQPLGYFWCFAMGFNEEIIKALTSLLNEEIIALTARCRQNKIQNLLCFMKSEILVSYTET